MDINNLLSGGPAPTPSKPAAPPPPPPPPPPQQQQQQHQAHYQQHQSLPSTPVQNGPSQSFRDYGQQPPQQSPTRGPSMDYGVHQMTQGPYGSPQTYQQPQGSYPGRPAPPPLQPLASHDLRSPSIQSGMGAGYGRPTPTSSISTTSGGYPFPAPGPGPQQTPSSPAQRHQYPPPSGYTGRDGYSAGSSGSQYLSGPPGPPLPQTPPVGTPGGAHPYLQQQQQQRTGSNFSATTPTSAHSQSQQQQQQSQYGGLPFGSPVSTSHQGLPQARQQSLPPTPLGPPLTSLRQSSIPQNVNYPQPSSPYQQRISTSSNQSSYPHSQHSVTQLSPRQQPSRISPAPTILPSIPPSIPRVPSNHSIYDNPAPSELHRRSQSQSERDRSVSVSPKTRLPSLPGPTPMASSAMGPDRERVERAVTPAKRKLDSRDLPLDELEKQDVRPPPFEKQNQNGHAVKQEAAQPPSQTAAASSPVMARKVQRKRHSKPPVWAMNYREDKLNAMNFVLHKPAHIGGTPQVNGRVDAFVKPELTSRHASPDEKRSIAASQPPSAPPPPPAQLQMAPPVSLMPNANGPLGPWETCISNVKPLNDMAKQVADFLFATVVNNPDTGEISSRDIQFEIEAKMGTIINKETDDRIDLPVLTECVLADTKRLAFRSDMTLAQHKAFNEYLNDCVNVTHRAKGARVPIEYRHRRETDKFYELPDPLRKQLPACIQSLIPGRHSVKVRVSYDQKTNRVIAMIIKARIADLHLYFPTFPLDCRISVNLEMPWDGDLEQLEKYAAGKDQQPDRKKDRLSYTQSVYQIDLTQVRHNVAGPHNTQREELEHEIEIEVSAEKVLEQGRLAAAGGPHQYTELVEGLIDNVRNLTRLAKAFEATA